MSVKSFTDPQERVRLLSKQAVSLAEIDFTIPLTRYFRAAKEIMRTAQYYENEDCLENAFVLYSKYITLFVEKFPLHPHYKKLDSKEKHAHYKGLNEVFLKAESVKQKLVKIYSLELRESEKELREEETSQVLGSRDTEKENEELRELEKKFALMRCKVQQDITDVSPLKIDQKISGLKNNKFADNNINNAPIPPPPYVSAVHDIAYLAPGNSNTFPQAIKPLFDRSLKPIIDNDHDGGLKAVCIPNNLAQEFLNRVQSNTSKNIETCAILCGRLQKQKWCVTHILIPNQFGKSDSCDIENDEEVVDFQDRHDLVTLGWIHTHPSQTAFLSSVDQHTHWPYQKLLPEAISVVCAPKFNEIGYFHLTPDFGMEFVQTCKGDGFHEHPIKPAIFQNAPHILLDPFLNIIVEDLRRNRK